MRQLLALALALSALSVPIYSAEKDLADYKTIYESAGTRSGSRRLRKEPGHDQGTIQEASGECELARRLWVLRGRDGKNRQGVQLARKSVVDSITQAGAVTSGQLLPIYRKTSAAGSAIRR